MIPQFVPYWGAPEKEAVLDVLDSDYLNEHKTVRAFEKEFAALVGARHCVTFTSGTAALYGAITAHRDTQDWRIPDHDGIFAFNAAVAAGKTPVLCDVDVHGVLPAGEAGAGSVTVHANGRIGRGGGSAIEDCSQATDHHTPDRTSTYSFASTKHITTGGQGGAVCCDDQATFDALSRIKDHGRNDRQNLKPMSDEFGEWGMNFKFTEIQAAFGLAQLRGFAQRKRRFAQIYGIYADVLGPVAGVDFDPVAPGWYADIFTDDPDAVKGVLAKGGFGSRRLPRPLHTQRLCGTCGVSTDGAFENTVLRHRRGLYLPSTTNLTDEEVKNIAQCIRSGL